MGPGRLILLGLGCWLLWLTACALFPTPRLATAAEEIRKLPTGLSYRLETRSQPRPLRIHEVVVDLGQSEVEPGAAVASDPDGPGGAESQLMPPSTLADSAGLFLAVNANAFAWFDAAQAASRTPRWSPGLPVDILGWAHDGRREASPPEPAYWSVWQDSDGRVRLGQARSSQPVRWAVAGFGALVMAGQEVPAEDSARHPRTAVGLDRSGRKLLLVVVDGRRPGHSEGMSLQELAAWMRARGCWEAINLDGGGSSVLLVRQGRDAWEVWNRPSDGRPRPVPVLLGVRLRAVAGSERSIVRGLQ